MASTPDTLPSWSLRKLSFRLAQSSLLFRILRTLLTGRFTPHARLIGPFIRGRVLDIGCGTGDFAHFVRGRYVGIDVDQVFLQAARQRVGRGFVLAADGTRLPFRDGSFGVVLLLHSLHHLSDDQARAILREAMRVSTGGIIVVDPIPPRHPGLRSWLHRMDRGGHMRGLAEQLALLGSVCEIAELRRFWSTTRLYEFTFLRCRRRAAPR